MSVLFASANGSAFDTGLGATSAGAIRSGWQTNGVTISGVSAAVIPLAPATASPCLHYRFSPPSGVNANLFDNAVATFSDNAGGRDVARVLLTDGNMSLQGWNGSSWATYAFTTQPSYFMGSLPGVRTIDIRLKLHATDGAFEVYLDGILFLAFAGNTILTASTTVDRISMLSPSGSTMAIAELIVADVPTITSLAHQATPNGAGADTGWTNDYTAIDETGLYSDADLLSAASAGIRESWDTTNLPAATAALLAGMDLVAGVNLHARFQTGAPQNLAPYLKLSSVNYDAATLTLTTSFAALTTIWATNPAGGAWTDTAFNGAQLGVLSIT